MIKSLVGISPSLFLGLFQAIHIGMPAKKKDQLINNFHNWKNEIDTVRSSTRDTESLAQSKYFAEVYVTGTKNGPGHISASLIKTTESTPQLITHTSYMPGIAGIINGISLGFIPILARNYPTIRADDIYKADKIIRLPLTEEEFNKGIERQQQIEERNDKGLQLYAITGAANPVASFLTGLFSAYYGAELAHKNFIKEYGFHPVEDLSGLIVTADSHHPESNSHLELMNCTAAVQSVLEATGLEFKEDYVAPMSLAEEILEQTSANEVDATLVAIDDGDVTVSRYDDFPIPNNNS